MGIFSTFSACIIYPKISRIVFNVFFFASVYI
nr:MAG TPA: hypothetical protein [Caudoviricetes sp.]DAT09677.1 MAG TPA: hypothetical protein [Caudoviricetes sp.]